MKKRAARKVAKKCKCKPCVKKTCRKKRPAYQSHKKYGSTKLGLAQMAALKASPPATVQQFPAVEAPTRPIDRSVLAPGLMEALSGADVADVAPEPFINEEPDILEAL